MKYSRQVDGVWVADPGHEALWLWFGLSYASWLTLPRALMHEMPDEWQAKMAELLGEWDEHWGQKVGEMLDGVSVTRRVDGKFRPLDSVLTDYRHPATEQIQQFKAA